MRDFGQPSISLVGSLLAAHPKLLDPNFRRSVLYVSTNDSQEGSFALAINRPSGRMVADLLRDRELGSLAGVPVFHGGPVSTDQLIFAAFQWRSETQRLDCRHHLVIEEAEVCAREANSIVRAFIGYAGWSRGQLENEIAQSSWLVQKAGRDAVDLENAGHLWRRVTSGFGPWYRLLAESPEDPSRN